MAEALAEDVARGLHPPGAGGLLPGLDHIFVRGLGWNAARARRVLPGTWPGNRGAGCSLSDHAGVSVELDLGRVDLPRSA